MGRTWEGCGKGVRRAWEGRGKGMETGVGILVDAAEHILPPVFAPCRRRRSRATPTVGGSRRLPQAAESKGGYWTKGHHCTTHGPAARTQRACRTRGSVNVSAASASPRPRLSAGCRRRVADAQRDRELDRAPARCARGRRTRRPATASPEGSGCLQTCKMRNKSVRSTHHAATDVAFQPSQVP